MIYCDLRLGDNFLLLIQSATASGYKMVNRYSALWFVVAWDKMWKNDFEREKKN